MSLGVDSLCLPLEKRLCLDWLFESIKYFRPTFFTETHRESVVVFVLSGVIEGRGANNDNVGAGSRKVVIDLCRL